VFCPRCGVTLSGREEATLPGPGHHVDPLAADAMIGRSIIGQFVVRHKLGEGGMGAVYLADQPEIGRTVVIKVIHPWLSKDPQIAERFAAEARAAARLHSPHIVAIHNYGRLPDGTLFLAMEHLGGSTLAEAIKNQGRMDATRAVAIARQVCEALTEAHRQGVIHRDLKPSNIMLLSRGQGPGFVKVLDFGVARIDGRDPGKGVVGTPVYMAPEQLAGGSVDGRSDIYSLAVILYEMLTGRPPLEARSAAEMAKLHASTPAPPPSTIAPGVWIPHGVEACLMRALAKEPHTRPQAADLFADELYNALMATVADHSYVPIPVPRAPSPSRSSVIGAVLGGMLLLAGASAGAYLFLRGAEHAGSGGAGTRGPGGEPEPTAARPPTDRASERDLEPSAAARSALERMSAGRLETELQRVAVLRGRSAADVGAALERHRRALAHPPPGVDPELASRSALADLVLSWHAAAPVADPAARPQDELEAVFLTMESNLDTKERSRMLNELKNGASDDPEARAGLRRRLVEWIADYGGAYMRATDPEDVEIEIEDENP
jgi:tRNA A-37 threonylcarbamoyl transferase component Bud32